MDGAKYPNRLRELRERSELTQELVAERMNVTVQCYQNYEYGKREMRAGTLRRAALVFGCSVAEVMGIERAEKKRLAESRGASVPVVADTNDDPREAVWSTDERWYVPYSVYAEHSEAFYVRVDDDSVNDLIPNGALALVDPSGEAESGELVAVRLEGHGTSIRRVYWVGDTVVLHPESHDPDEHDYSFDRTNPDAPAMDVLGRVVSYTAPEGWRP